MFNINREDLKQYANIETIKKGEKLAERDFFPISYIEERENQERYDTLIYKVDWRYKGSYWYNSTQIEVDINDKIISFDSSCSCWAEDMCEHTVCLALTIPTIIADRKEKLGEEEYSLYEEKLIRKYKQKKLEYLEEKRKQEVIINKKRFNRILREYKELNKKVVLGNKVSLEIIINFDINITLGFKVGAQRKYIVKDMIEFLNAVKKKNHIKYGKHLEFYHDINNFDKTSQKVIKLLLNNTSYWADDLYPFYAGIRYRYMKLTPSLLSEIFSIYTGGYIAFLKSGEYKDVFISDKKIHGKLYLDEEKIILKGVKDYKVFLSEKKNYIYFDDTLYPLEGVSDYLVPIYEELSHDNKIIIEDTFASFLKEVYPLIHDEVEVEFGFKEKYPVKSVKIDSYFDLEKDKLYLTSKYFLGDEETNINYLQEGSYSYSKLKKYQDYISGLGFDEDNSLNVDNIAMFINADLSFLRSLGDVYLSENIKSLKVKKMSKPVVNLKYDVDFFSVAFENLGYSNDDLLKIINAYKKKKKFIKLENDIIEINNENVEEILDIVDDFDLDLKSLDKDQEKPLYLSAKVSEKYSNDNITINIDEKLKELISKIKNYKESDYEVPVSLQAVMRDYQIEAFKWLKTLTEHKFCGILADDMGLGKSLEMLSLIVSDEKQMPTIIIVPTSLIYNWEAEIKKWAKDIPYKTIIGSIEERHELIKAIDSEKKCIYITSYDTYRNDVKLYLDKRFRFAILDEAQYIKNYYTQKARAVKLIASEVRFVLTGTPIENSLLDLWSIFDFLLPGYLQSHNKFKNKYGNIYNNQELLNSLVKKITPFVLRRTKKNVLKDLPEKFETISYATMTPEQRKVYEAYLLSIRTNIESKSKFEVLSALTRLRQLCVHPGMFLENYHGGSAKIEVAMVLITQSIANGHKILLFSQFTKAFPYIEAELKKAKIKYFVLEGKTKAIERINLVDEFNENDEIKVFLISLKAGGTGLNLIGADIVLHLDPWWNIAAENQATDRAHRIGQKQSVQVIKLVCENSIEQKVIELQEIKKDLSEKVIASDDENILKLDDENIDYLLR